MIYLNNLRMCADSWYELSKFCTANVIPMFMANKHQPFVEVWGIPRNVALRNGAQEVDEMTFNDILVNNTASVMQEFLDFAMPTYEKSTVWGALDKLRDELQELEQSGFQIDEYVDCFSCLLYAMAKKGYTLADLNYHWKLKTAINKQRKWKYNAVKNNYQHVNE